jgi:hypothetical protein
MGKRWYTSKTMWTGATGFVGGLAAFFTTGDTVALSTSLMGLLMMGLRRVTNQPIE